MHQARPKTAKNIKQAEVNSPLGSSVQPVRGQHMHKSGQFAVAAANSYCAPPGN